MLNNTNIQSGIRIPRIKGSTPLALSHQLPNLYSHLISDYIQNGFTYLGRAFSIPQFSEHTNIPEKVIMDQVINSMGPYARMLEKDYLQGTLRALLSEAILGASRDKAIAQEFAGSLRNQAIRQGEDGNPVVNIKAGYLYQRALETQFHASQNFVGLISQLMPRGTTNILIQGAMGPEDSPQKAGYITREEALELVGQQGQPLMLEGHDNPDAEALFRLHGLADTPEVKVGADGPMGSEAVLLTEVNEEIITEIEDEEGQLL